MKIRNVVLLVFSLCFFRESHAGTDLNFSFMPQPATVDDSIDFRVDFTGCFDSPVSASVNEQERIITVTILGSDVSCDEENPENYISPKFAGIGLLAAGRYETQVVVCGILAPPPEPSCSLLEEGILVVRGGGGMPATIPASSGFGNGALVFLLLMVAVEVLRRR